MHEEEAKDMKDSGTPYPEDAGVFLIFNMTYYHIFYKFFL